MPSSRASSRSLPRMTSSDRPHLSRKEDAMTDNDQIVELPTRFAMTLVDTGSLLGSAMFGTDPIGTPSGTGGTTGGTADPTGTAPSTSDPLGGALARVSDASPLAQSTGAGAQAQNIDSAGSSTVATAP